MVDIIEFVCTVFFQRTIIFTPNPYRRGYGIFQSKEIAYFLIFDLSFHNRVYCDSPKATGLITSLFEIIIGYI